MKEPYRTFIHLVAAIFGLSVAKIIISEISGLVGVALALVCLFFTSVMVLRGAEGS